MTTKAITSTKHLFLQHNYMNKILTIALALAFGTSLCAQSVQPKTAAFNHDSILFWVGSGTNSASFIISWDDESTPTAYIWGIHFSTPTVTAAALLDSIVAHDHRFTYSGASGSQFVTWMHYDDTVNNEHHHGTSDSYWCYDHNGGGASAYGLEQVYNGDSLQVSSSCMYGNVTVRPATNPNAASDPVDAAIDSASIRYWVGAGCNYAIMAVNWASPVDTALAWGYRFDGTKTIADMMNDIDAMDPRFSYTAATGYISDILFVTDNGDTLKLAPSTPSQTYGNYWSSNVNGVSSMGMSQTLANGDFAKWGDASIAVGYNWDSTHNYYTSNAWTKTVVAVPPMDPVDATISAEAIEFWVGTGNSQAILAVNWASPTDTALAWGYRFNDSVSLTAMMDAVAETDSRFSYIQSNGHVSDILYVMNNGDTLKLAPSTPDQTYGNYWGENLNGHSGRGLADIIRDGDLVKWGDATIAIGLNWDSVYMYYRQNVWVKPIVPAPVNITSGPFCGAVGTEGCEAIAADSRIFVAWATGCTVERGWQNIATPTARVSHGSDSMAIGRVSMTDNINVVSLGDGGTATLTFATPIQNGDGFDFCVFENGFNDYFLELAFVEVSSDGSHFVRFPATSLTPVTTQIGGMGSVDPTFIDNLAGKYRMGYGTPFDLSELADSANLDITHITHVRLVDVVGSIDPQYGSYDAYGHLVNDPYPTAGPSGGFDLAGIGVIHQQPVTIDAVTNAIINVFPNPVSHVLNVTLQGCTDNAVLRLFDVTGHEVLCRPMNGSNLTLNVENLRKGIYVLQVAGITQKIVVR